MIHHVAITAPLLIVAVGIAWISSLGLLVMRDPFQRLQFSAPIVTLSAFCVLVAVWVEDSNWQSRIKMTIVAVVLVIMNSVLTHATARAIRIRKLNRWLPSPDEKIPVAGNKGIAGPSPFAPMEDGSSKKRHK